MPIWLINVLLLVLGILLGVTAQVLLKHGVRAGALTPAQLPALLLTWPVVVGLTLYVLAAANWLIVLSRLPLSYAYPVMSLGYVATFIIGIWLFKEPWTARQLIGLAVIIVGVALITPPRAVP